MSDDQSTLASMHPARRRQILAGLRISGSEVENKAVKNSDRLPGTLDLFVAPLPEPRGSVVSSAVAAPPRSGKAPAPLVSRRNGRRRIAFGWYGGKFSHLAWLLPLLPKAKQYCEPFAGSGAVLLNRPPSGVETYNDLDGEVVNFFRVLREHRDAFVDALRDTPFSREEFALACDAAGPEVSSFERARRFYIRARQVRFGLAQTASIGRWANCKNTSRAGMAGVVSRWIGGIEGLREVADRLVRVQIENRPAVEIIRLYDDRNTLFYVDPPYPHESRSDSKAYGYEMADDEHGALAEVVNSVRGKVAVSGYDCPLMRKLYKRWTVHRAELKMSHTAKDFRQEVLWTNY